MAPLKSKIVSRFIADYGMAVVLVLLCGYYSWATLKPQQVVGEEAGRVLANELRSTLPNGGKVLIVAKAGAEDARFVEALDRHLHGGPIQVVATVQGEPADARKALTAVVDSGGKLDAVATTEDCASWLVLTRMKDRFPTLAETRVMSASSYLWPTFLKADNLFNVANQVVVISLLAVGLTMVIITGGIDLSVGSMVALSAVVAALVIQRTGGYNATTTQMASGVLAGIGLCALVGAASGGLVAFFKIPPFITTLGMMLVASGMAYIIAEGQSIYEIPDTFTRLGRGADVFGIPNAVLLMLGVYVLAHVLMSRTALGRYIYAVGGNVEAARLSGVRVRRVLLFVYVVSGAMAGLGGILVASQLKSGSPTYGLMYELYAIAAVVVGGTSLSGGSGKILGTLIGALIIAVIQNGMNLTQTESYRQKVVLGLIILAAVMLDMFRKQGWRLFREA
jgi:ribose transport system permease protein